MNVLTRRVLIGLFVFLVAVGAISVGAFQSPPNTIKTYVLRVRATQTGQPVDVTGAVWVSGSQERVEVIHHMTPIEYKLTGDTVAALLKSDRASPIYVELREVGADRTAHSARGVSVVLVQGLAPNVEWGFTKSF